MKTIGIITVRWDSTRLPGKALAMLGNKPLLQHTVDNLSMANLDQPPIVVTTKTSQPIIDYCIENQIDYVAGVDDGDVLSQMLLAVKDECIIVRIWGDNPFPASALINSSLEFSKNNRVYSYLVAHTSDSYCSIINSSLLKAANRMALDPKDRYDIHTWMVNNLPSCILNYPLFPFKTTVDTKEDLDRIERGLWVKSGL